MLRSFLIVLLYTLFEYLLYLFSSLFILIIETYTIFLIDGYYSLIVLITYQKYLISTISNISLHILINLINLNSLNTQIYINPTIYFINLTDSTTSIPYSCLRNFLQLFDLLIASDHLFSFITNKKISVFVSSTKGHFFLAKDRYEISKDYYGANFDGKDQ